MVHVEDYAPIVGTASIDELRLLADRLQGNTLQNINSTAVGGGVAEILTRMVPLMKQLGVDAVWDVIKGDEKFFAITKKMHNGLHGVPVEISAEEQEHFQEVNRENAEQMRFGDMVYVHDPQPIALVEKRGAMGKKWAWRCHIDFSQPDPKIWEFLKRFIERYDAAVFSAPAFAQKLPIPQGLVSPSIDPLSDKNKEPHETTIEGLCRQVGNGRSRAVVPQISRIDFLKVPLGVIKAYRLAKQNVDRQLALAGGGATDDPEGPVIIEQVKTEPEKDKAI